MLFCCHVRLHPLCCLLLLCLCACSDVVCCMCVCVLLCASCGVLVCWWGWCDGRVACASFLLCVCVILRERRVRALETRHTRPTRQRKNTDTKAHPPPPHQRHERTATAQHSPASRVHSERGENVSSGAECRSSTVVQLYQHTPHLAHWA